MFRRTSLSVALGAALHTDSLHIHPALLHAAILKSELLDFQTKHTASGYMQHNAREGAHDDILLALVIGLFHADDRGDRSHSNWMEFMRRGGISSAKKLAEQKPHVTLKSPTNTNITTVYLMSGRSLNVSEDGTVELDQDDATPLLQAGWQLAA